MPNYCDFDIHVRGKKKDVLTLFDWMDASYCYCEKELDPVTHSFIPLGTPECYVLKDGKRIDVPHHVGYRIFEVNINDEDYKDLPEDDEVCIYGWGYCAWSVYSCMFEGPHTYYSDDKDYPVSLSITLPDACKELSLDAEIYSNEPGMCFAEHFLISNEGEILINDCVDFEDVYIEEYDTFEDLEADSKERGNDSPPVTKEEFDNARANGECSIHKCEWLTDGDWPFEIV